MKTLFRQEGLKWLSGCELPADQPALVDSDLRLIKGVDQEIAELEASLRQQAWNQIRVRLLMTILGVDDCAALPLVAALGDLSRFADSDHAAGYLGLTPSVKQSAIDPCAVNEPKPTNGRPAFVARNVAAEAH